MIINRPIQPKRQPPMTAKERTERFDALCKIGCIVCRERLGVHAEPAIHHLIGINSSRLGNGGKADCRETLGLCQFHHQGEQGIHHLGMRAWEGLYGTQQKLLTITNQLIQDEIYLPDRT